MNPPTRPAPDSVPPAAGPHLPPGVYRINAAAALDARGLIAGPASLLVQIGPVPAAGPFRPRATLLAAGTPAEIDPHPAAPAAHRIDRPASILIPGLVN